MARVHVIGAGLAGLASATALVAQGRDVTVYEMAGHAGGRCRSFHDAALDCLIDNGNHLLMSANRAAKAYLDLIGSKNAFWSPPGPAYPFIDLATGERWTFRPNMGTIPWWIFVPGRRVGGTRLGDYLSGRKLPSARADQTVADCIDPTSLIYKRFWEPLTVAALNTDPTEASAQVLWRVMAETFARGGRGCIPMVARDGLGPALVDPAVAFLRRHGSEIKFNTRVREIALSDDRATALTISGDGQGGTETTLGPDDAIILAVPPAAAASLVPALVVPMKSRAIVNAHFKLTQTVADEPVSFLGLIGATADWLFIRGEIVSVTVSAADDLASRSNDDIAQILWRDTAAALGLDDQTRVAARIINEKRATFAQTPADVARRPSTRSRWQNMVVAGDWTDTGLPASIEGALRSAAAAADALRH